MIGEFLIIVALGDSITTGFRTKDPYAIDSRVPYPSQLQAMIRHHFQKTRSPIQSFVVNAGINGDSTDGMLWRFDHDVAQKRPDIVLLMGGLNDLGAGKEPDEIVENLKSLIGRVRDIEAKTILCTITPTRRTSSKMKKLNELISTHCFREDIILADVYTPLADTDGNLQEAFLDDCVHLNFKGYRQVAQTIFRALEKSWMSD